MSRSPSHAGKAAAHFCAEIQAAVEEAASEEAASEDAASLEASEAASEAASLEASEEALFSSTTTEEAEASDCAATEAASEVEAAVEEELPQAVMLTARTRAATVTTTFLSFISKISSCLKIVLREARTGGTFPRKDILVTFRKKSRPFSAKILFTGEILHFCYNFSIKVEDF